MCFWRRDERLLVRSHAFIAFTSPRPHRQLTEPCRNALQSALPQPTSVCPIKLSTYFIHDSAVSANGCCIRWLKKKDSALMRASAQCQLVILTFFLKNLHFSRLKSVPSLLNNSSIPLALSSINSVSLLFSKFDIINTHMIRY